MQYLDILAVSIASDIVPIIGENRLLAYHGLKKLNSSPSVGLKSIIEVSGLQGKEITISDIVFVIGIVASRLTESYYRPTIVLTESNGLATGSARSVDGFDLYKAIDSCSDLLENFGGHMYAAGLTMKLENVEPFIERFEQYVSANILPEQLIPQIDIDAELYLSDITPGFYNILTQFEPFGPGNLKPVFVTRNVYDYGHSKLVGKDKDAVDVDKSKKHLKLEVTDPQSRCVMNGVGFNMGHMIDPLKNGESVSLCYTIEMNEFKGYRNLQIMVKDMLASNPNNQ